MKPSEKKLREAVENFIQKPDAGNWALLEKAMAQYQKSFDRK